MTDSLIDNISKIAKEAGSMMENARGVKMSVKGTKDNIVTSADVEIERFLKGRLTDLIPGSVFIGEEGDENALPEHGPAWIVDPIDGTTNFSRGIPMCCVSIALFEDGKPRIGVVYDPFTDALFKGEVGKGSTFNGIPMHVSKRPVANSILCTAWCTYHKELAPACFRISERMHPICEDIRRIGTAAYELCLLANGSVDLYFEINLSPWDYAAALICVSEAGGVFSRIDGKMTFDRQGPVVAANNRENLDYLLKVVREETER